MTDRWKARWLLLGLAVGVLTLPGGFRLGARDATGAGRCRLRLNTRRPPPPETGAPPPAGAAAGGAAPGAPPPSRAARPSARRHPRAGPGTCRDLGRRSGGIGSSRPPRAADRAATSVRERIGMGSSFGPSGSAAGGGVPIVVGVLRIGDGLLRPGPRHVRDVRHACAAQVDSPVDRSAVDLSSSSGRPPCTGATIAGRHARPPFARRRSSARFGTGGRSEHSGTRFLIHVGGPSTCRSRRKRADPARLRLGVRRTSVSTRRSSPETRRRT